MRILIVDTTLDGPLIGGAQTFLGGLIRGLTDLQHEVHLVARNTPDNRVREAIDRSGAILHTRLWRKKALVDDNTPLFADWINKLAPDIYLVSVSSDIGWTVLPHLDPGIATIAIGHTDDATFYLPAKHYHSFLTGVIGVSHEVCGHFITDCKISKDRAEWIPYGVKVNPNPPLQPESDAIQMVYVGRLEEQQKRVSDLAAVAQALSAAQLPFHLEIIGDGPEMNSLKTRMREEITAKKASLLGWQPSAEVIASLRQSEVFLLTSAYEGFCIALVEAMANGCVPVVTDIRSGNKDLIRNGENGFIVGIGDIKGFVEKLKWLHQDRSLLIKMRQAAWQTGRNYGVSQMVMNYHHFFYKNGSGSKEGFQNGSAWFPFDGKLPFTLSTLAAAVESPGQCIVFYHNKPII